VKLPRLPLRHLNATEVANGVLTATAAAAGLVLVKTPLPATGPLLEVRVACTAMTLHGLVAAETLVPALPAGLSDLAWPVVGDPSAFLALWPTPPVLASTLPVLAGARAEVIGVQSPLQARAAALPAVQCTHGTLWVQALEPVAGATPPMTLPHALRELAQPLDLRIAHLCMTRRQLRRLSPGAVLLLDTLHPVGVAADRKLFTFDFTLENCTVNDMFDFLDDAPHDMPADVPATADAPTSLAAGGAPVGLDAARLPVTLEVILSRVPQTVGDLAKLVPGTVFPLPADAWMRLQLRTHGQTIATGELVQVGEQLGVLLHQQPRRT